MQKYYSYIFVDESNSKQYPRLIKLLQRLNTKLPADFEKLYNVSVEIFVRDEKRSMYFFAEEVGIDGRRKMHIRHILV